MNAAGSVTQLAPSAVIPRENSASGQPPALGPISTTSRAPPQAASGVERLVEQHAARDKHLSQRASAGVERDDRARVFPDKSALRSSTVSRAPTAVMR